MKYIDAAFLDNVATFLFILHPFFMYKMKNLDNVDKNNSWLKIKKHESVVYYMYGLLLILPPLWLLLNWQLANILLMLFILGVFYLFKGVLDDVNEIRKSK